MFSTHTLANFTDWQLITKKDLTTLIKQYDAQKNSIKKILVIDEPPIAFIRNWLVTTEIKILPPDAYLDIKALLSTLRSDQKKEFDQFISNNAKLAAEKQSPAYKCLTNWRYGSSENSQYNNSLGIKNAELILLLPLDILVLIFAYLTTEDLVNFKLSCRQFYKFQKNTVSKHSLWDSSHKRITSNSMNNVDFIKPIVSNWKLSYAQFYKLNSNRLLGFIRQDNVNNPIVGNFDLQFSRITPIDEETCAIAIRNLIHLVKIDRQKNEFKIYDTITIKDDHGKGIMNLISPNPNLLVIHNYFYQEIIIYNIESRKRKEIGSGSHIFHGNQQYIFSRGFINDDRLYQWDLQSLKIKSIINLKKLPYPSQLLPALSGSVKKIISKKEDFYLHCDDYIFFINNTASKKEILCLGSGNDLAALSSDKIAVVFDNEIYIYQNQEKIQTIKINDYTFNRQANMVVLSDHVLLLKGKYDNSESKNDSFLLIDLKEEKCITELHGDTSNSVIKIAHDLLVFKSDRENLICRFPRKDLLLTKDHVVPLTKDLVPNIKR